MNSTELEIGTHSEGNLDFLWVELTNQCNLRCMHCYAESGPNSEVSNPLSTEEYRQLLAQAFDAGCRRMQFIGGEPTLNRDLQELIYAASRIGYEFVEVYSNLTRLPDELLSCFKEYNVHLATSVYAPSEVVHDLITQTPGSFARSIANIRKVVSAGISIRVAVIEMAQNANLTDATVHFIKNEIGVPNVKVDRLRPFGRGATGDVQMRNLCGGCAEGTLCIGSGGEVSPCIMSKRWTIGSVRHESFADIVLSERLSNVREEIRRAVFQPQTGDERAYTEGLASDQCAPKTRKKPKKNECNPIRGCPPLNRCAPEINN